MSLFEPWMLAPSESLRPSGTSQDVASTITVSKKAGMRSPTDELRLIVGGEFDGERAEGSRNFSASLLCDTHDDDDDVKLVSQLDGLSLT
ncbi:hypothetical protein EJB05_32272, partial [Eragrostis curvula]